MLEKVARGKSLQLLLVEDDLEDENLIREALIEIEESHSGRWCSCNLTHVDRLADALDCIRAERYDAILLNLSLPDAPALLDAFLEVHASAGDVPIIVLADEDDSGLAERFIREGAQDVVVKRELECAPLARSICYAMERSRRLAALEARFFLDELTGAYNRKGFLHLASHCLRLANTLLLVLDLGAVFSSKEELDLVLIRSVEVARSLFAQTSLIGRVDSSSLGLLAIGLKRPQADSLVERWIQDLYSVFPNAAGLRFGLLEAEPGDSPQIVDLLQACERTLAFPAMLAD